MTVTPSNMPELGLPAPDFSLPNVDGRAITRADFADAPALLVAFWCNHCPYVQHIREAFAEFSREYQKKGLAIVAIMSNDVTTYPADHPDRMKEEAERFGFTFPYLYDALQAVAKSYDAACTPDFFLYDRERKLVYRGRFDASRPNQGMPVTGIDLREAIDTIMAGKVLSPEQAPSIGCNIKWLPGNSPGQ